MEINKQKFREIVEEGEVGQALNQLSDISHFLGESAMQEELEAISERYLEYLELEETGSEQTEEAGKNLQQSLLAFIDRLPEEFAVGEGGADDNKGGCIGVLLLLVTLSSLLFLFIK